MNRSPQQMILLAQSKMKRNVPLKSFNQRYPCIFFLSTGRVGTQTIASLLRLSSNSIVYHEPRPYLFELSKAAYMYSESAEAHQALCAALETTRRDLWLHALNCRMGYIETSPQVTFLAPAIFSILPEAKFVHVVRHPANVIRSGMRRKWYAGVSTDPTRIVPNPDLLAGQLWDNYDHFQKNIWLWTETNKWIIEFLSKIPADKQLFIRSEDVFSKNPDTLQNIYEFAGTNLPSEQKINKILNKALNSQNDGEFPLFEDWTSNMKNELIKQADKTASTLGYNLHSM